MYVCMYVCMYVYIYIYIEWASALVPPTPLCGGGRAGSGNKTTTAGSFEPVEKERLGLPQPLAFCHQNLAPEKEPLGLPQPLVWQLQVPVWRLSRGLRG